MKNIPFLEDLSLPIQMIGRKQELERLEKHLHAPGTVSHFVYYWAHGGLGKTRLLEELVNLVKQAGPGFYCSGIIDLYHADTHSTSDLERIIIESLDPEVRHFSNYRSERERYERLRELRTDPGVLEKRRAGLAQFFVEGFKEMALDAKKIVLIFDTIELLQYESSIVEEKAGLATADTRIKPWLLRVLPVLPNVLTVLAGRPKEQAPDEAFDPQARLVEDLQTAFEGKLSIVQLNPFTAEETATFIASASGGIEIIPEQALPVVQRLTGGKPIYLHLLIDLLKTLSPEPRSVIGQIEQYTELANVPEDDERLKTAREEIERKILDAIFNEAGELAGYLSRIALMPKGVDAEILNVVLGIPIEEATLLLEQLQKLSFVKHFISPGSVAEAQERYIFLHDEMYRLLNQREIIRNLRMNERAVANDLVKNYYDPYISKLDQDIATNANPDHRAELRVRLQKLQIERLYYLLVSNPRIGYEEYIRLTEESTRYRWGGFGMRLLDEFLRFYNVPERRKLFEAAGLPHEQVIRQSTWLWVERFDWWGQDQRVVEFAGYVISHPEEFFINPEQDLAILGNIYAFWAGAWTRLYGYDSDVANKAQMMLEQLPPLDSCNPEQKLARARLSTTLGYHFRMGGMLQDASDLFTLAQKAFRSLEPSLLQTHLEEYTLLLANAAISYARQGKMVEARTLAHEALRLNEEAGTKYGTGMTLVHLSAIARGRGSHAQALGYAEESLTIFQELEDTRGVTLAHLRAAQAKRLMAKHELEKGRRSEDYHRESYDLLKQALHALESALKSCEEAGITVDIPNIHAEIGRCYRDMGLVVERLTPPEQNTGYYRQGEDHLKIALAVKSWPKINRADALQDLAEIRYYLKDSEGAYKFLAEVEQVIGEEYLHEEYAPLGKVATFRGKMALDQGDMEQGWKHYIHAYVYFTRFSKDSVEKDIMVEHLYTQLRGIPIEQQQTVLNAVNTWIMQNDFGVNVSEFVEMVQNLLGV